MGFYLNTLSRRFEFVTTQRRLRRSQWRHCPDTYGRRPPTTEMTP